MIMHLMECRLKVREQIKRICTAVTASEEVISQAVAWQADALIGSSWLFLAR